MRKRVIRTVMTTMNNSFLKEPVEREGTRCRSSVKALGIEIHHGYRSYANAWLSAKSNIRTHLFLLWESLYALLSFRFLSLVRVRTPFASLLPTPPQCSPPPIPEGAAQEKTKNSLAFFLTHYEGPYTRSQCFVYKVLLRLEPNLR